MLAASLFLAFQGSPVIQASGATHMLTLCADGKVYGWGHSASGELGSPDKSVVSDYSVIRPTLIPLPEKMIQIATAMETSYSLSADGSVYAWGRGYYGQLGNGKAGTESRIYPNGVGRATAEKIPGLTNVKQIATCASTAFAVRSDGSVYAWGSNSGGALANGARIAYLETPPQANEPIKIESLSDIVQVSGGGAFALALNSKGQVYSWGSNGAAQLGRGPKTELGMSTPQLIPNLDHVVQVAAGNGVSTVLKSDGTVWVWGGNTYGQFGNGIQIDSREANGSSPIPRKVPGLTNVTAISLGIMGRYTIALLKDGTIRTWGNSDFGQCGAGVSGQDQLQIKKPAISGVKKIFACGNNGFAIKENGQLFYWGNHTGKVGILAKNLATPTQLKW